MIPKFNFNLYGSLMIITLLLLCGGLSQSTLPQNEVSLINNNNKNSQSLTSLVSSDIEQEGPITSATDQEIKDQSTEFFQDISDTFSPFGKGKINLIVDSLNNVYDIQSNADLEALNLPGSGTVNDPYILKNQVITSFRISNTDLYLRITNNSISGSVISVEEANFGFKNTSNIELSKNYIENSIGIVETSSNLNITGNEFNSTMSTLQTSSLFIERTNLNFSNNIMVNSGGVYLLPSISEDKFSGLDFKNNTLNDAPLVFVKDQINYSVPTGASQVIIVNSVGTEIRETNFENVISPITIMYSNFTIVDNVDINNTVIGISDSVASINTTISNSSFKYSQQVTIQNIVAANSSYTGNIIDSTYIGIDLVQSKNVTISGNEIIDSSDALSIFQISVIDTLLFNDNIITNSEFTLFKNENTAYLNLSLKTSNNTLNGNSLIIIYEQENTLISNQNAIILLVNSNNTQIRNVVSSNGTIGISIFNSRNTIIEGGTVKNNSRSGIFVSFESSDVLIENSIISNNEGYGVDGNENNSTIQTSVITNNGLDGVKAFSKILNSNISSNGGHGISLYGTSEIINNTISDNSNKGIQTQGRGIRVIGNNITGNLEEGLSISDRNILVQLNNFISNNGSGSQIEIVEGFSFGATLDIVFQYNHYSTTTGTDNDGDFILDTNQQIGIASFTDNFGDLNTRIITDNAAIVKPTWDYTIAPVIRSSGNYQFDGYPFYNSYEHHELLEWKLTSMSGGSYTISFGNGTTITSGQFVGNSTTVTLDVAAFNLGSYNIQIEVIDEFSVDTNTIQLDVSDVSATLESDDTIRVLQNNFSYVEFAPVTNREVEYALFIDDNLHSSGVSPTISAEQGIYMLFVVDSSQTGEFNYTLVIYGVNGDIVASSTVMVTVFETNTPNIAFYGSDLTQSYLEGETGNNLEWIVTDANPATYQISRDGNYLVTDEPWTNGTISLNIDGLNPGEYSYLLEVSDIYGNSNSLEILVTVKAVDDTDPTTNTSPTTSQSPTEPASSENGLYIQFLSVIFGFSLIEAFRRKLRI